MSGEIIFIVDICNTIKSVQMHEERLKLNLPSSGAVRSMIITEKQYASMNILTGKRKKKKTHLILK